MRRTLICTIFGLLLVNTSTIFALDCTRDEAIQAETEASTLPDWDSLYASFERFSHCDDGAISEGYSETVGRLLANDWENVGKLCLLAKKDAVFKKFVLRHIDATVPMEYLTKIIDNADQRCPEGSRFFCKLIYDAARK